MARDLDLKTAAAPLIDFVVNETPFILNGTVAASAKTIAFNPIFWNVVAQLEYRYGLASKLVGNRTRAVYLFSLTVFSLGLFRDFVYYRALETQPVAPLLDHAVVRLLGYALTGIGSVLVVSSMWALGVSGTYLGDHFGFLKDERITSFPFNVVNNPMYVGSYLSFTGAALYKAKAIGLVLSTFVWIMYRIALLFEEPFTDKIYTERSLSQQKKRV